MYSKGKIQREAMVFDIQRFSVQDGPGIRTVVFLKGCPLSCWWCANPESRDSKPEIAFISARCNKCKKCLSVCTEGLIAMDTIGTFRIDRSRCTLCGKCTEVCYPEALTIYGREMSCQEILEIVKKDEIFYGNSGGVTLSGGEVLTQPSLAISCLKACHESGIHTCIETSGYGGTEELRKILRVVDMVLFDLKHMDSKIHREYTGKSNGLILQNAKVVASSGVSVTFRFPLIPGVNDALENVKETAGFVGGLGENPLIEILPYHRLGRSKYQFLDKPYLLEGTEPPTKEHTQRVQKMFESFGIQAKIVW